MNDTRIPPHRATSPAEPTLRALFRGKEELTPVATWDYMVKGNDGVETKYLNGLGIDNKLRQTTGADVNYFLTDHLGSTNALTDASGNLTSQASYDSFGNQSGDLPTRYRFTGRERDDATGLTYYRARWYTRPEYNYDEEIPLSSNLSTRLLRWSAHLCI